ncbi:hypothetical protein KBD20_02830 [Candidatus Saccharibacteria bacterium]|nr:hypothetical protein [Candidatus Saccharibacteria bacterium]
MIDLTLKQNWLDESSDTALEELKSVFLTTLNSFPEDRHSKESRWQITKITEGDFAHLLYDEKSIATFQIIDSQLRFVSSNESVPRFDDIMYAIRYSASRLSIAVYSNLHKSSRLPENCKLSLDQTYFKRDKQIVEFFNKTDFIPRYALEGIENLQDGRQVLSVYAPYYVESKKDGTVHIINNRMLDFLVQKENQKTSQEFSYKVADSMNDFANKYDLGLIPPSFYQNYQKSVKIINETAFDVFNINRKVFIDPYVWDYDDQHNKRYYKNIENGTHLMDKVRKGEDLTKAIKRILKEELKLSEDFVAARIWGIEFDRDKEGILTPRLQMHIFVHGLKEHHRSQQHDWVSIK